MLELLYLYSNPTNHIYCPPLWVQCYKTFFANFRNKPVFVSLVGLDSQVMLVGKVASHAPSEAHFSCSTLL